MFLAYNDDVFGGYGVFGTGATEDESIKTAYKEYRKISKSWNEGVINCKTINAFIDEWGLRTRELKPGQSGMWED